MEKQTDRAFIEKRIEEVFDRSYLATLGTIDSGGAWVAEVIFISNTNKLYWMSSPNVRHSKAIKINPKIAVLITASNLPDEKDFCVQMSGVAQKAKDVGAILVGKYLLKQGKLPVGGAIKALKEGYEWYEFIPEFAELTDKENFGLEKQKIHFD